MTERAQLARSIAVLAWVADHPESKPSVRRIARDLECSASTIHRIFQIFQECGYLTRDDDGEYRLGLELFRVSERVARRLSITELARRDMTKLADKTGETVVLNVYDRTRRRMMILDVVNTSQPLSYRVEANTWMPVHAGASGLAIFAFLPSADRRAIAESNLEQLTDRTLVTSTDLEDAVRTVHDNGYIRTSGQRLVGAVGIAAPLFDCNDDVLGDICITIPSQRFQDTMEGQLADDLLEACRRINTSTRSAGYRRP